MKALTSGGNRIVLGDDSGNVYASHVAIEFRFPGTDLSDYATKKNLDDEIAKIDTRGDTTLLEGEFDDETGIWTTTAKAYDSGGNATGEQVDIETFLADLEPIDDNLPACGNTASVGSVRAAYSFAGKAE